MQVAQRSAKLTSLLLGLMLLAAPVFQGCSSPKPKVDEVAAPPGQEAAAKRYKQEAKSKFEKEDYKGAVVSWTEFIQANDNKTSEEAGYYNRGRAQMKLQNAKAAEQDFSEALKIDPESAKTYGRRAEARSVLGNQAGATADLQQAIGLYKKQGKEKEAQKVAAKLTQVQQGIPLTDTSTQAPAKSDKSAAEKNAAPAANPAPAKSTTPL